MEKPKNVTPLSKAVMDNIRKEASSGGKYLEDLLTMLVAADNDPVLPQSEDTKASAEIEESLFQLYLAKGYSENEAREKIENLKPNKS